MKKSHTIKKAVPRKKIKKISQNDQKHLVPTLVKLLKTARGPEKAVNMDWIIRYLKGKKGVALDRRQVQLLLGDIRIKGIVPCLIGDTNGYYTATSADMAHQYENRLISLIGELNELLKAFHTQSNKKFGLKTTLAAKLRKNKAVIKKVSAGYTKQEVLAEVERLRKERKTFKHVSTRKSNVIEMGGAAHIRQTKGFIPNTVVDYYKRGKKTHTEMYGTILTKKLRS